MRMNKFGIKDTMVKKYIILIINYIFATGISLAIFDIICTNPSNRILIERFINLSHITFLIPIFWLVLFGASFWAYKMIDDMKSLKVRFCFYIPMVVMVIVFIIAGCITQGEAIRSFLFSDPIDSFMDFYNCVQVGTEPYKNQMIYPPFIHLIYSFFSKLVVLQHGIPGNRALYLANTQMGKVIFGIYNTSVFILLSYVIYKMKMGGELERFFCVGILLLSAPVLFAFERGNSILLALLFILGYLKGYKSRNNYIRYAAFFSLACAAGIKISPAIFGLLLLREKKYKDIIISIIIGLIVFFIPFIFMDGNIKDLMNNINYTTNLFTGNITDGDGHLRIIGTAPYVGLNSITNALGRIINVNLSYYVPFASSIILFYGVFLILVVRSIPEWKVLAILCGVTILCPGFSAVYTLVLLVPALLTFLDEKEHRNILDYYYCCLFLLMFVPLVNFKIPLFRLFNGDIYPLRLSTAIEGLGLFLMVISLELEATVALFSEKVSVFAIPSKCKLLFGLIACCGFVYVVTLGYTARPVDAFYPIKWGAKKSIEGFILDEGQYKWMGHEAAVLLESKGILEKGLLVSFAMESNTSMLDNDQRIAIYINQQLLTTSTINLCKRPYIYIEPSELLNSGVEENQSVLVSLKIEDNIDSLLPFCYVGPAELLSSIQKGKYITATTGGLHKRFNDNQLWMGLENNILLNRSEVQDGLLLCYRAPAELLELTAGNELNLEIFVDGMLKKTVRVDRLDPQVIVLQPLELINTSSSHRAIELSLKINMGFSDDDLGVSEDKRKRSLMLDSIEPCNPSACIEYTWVDKNVTQYFQTIELQDTGLDIVYQVPNGLYNAGFNQPLILHILQNDNLIYQHIIDDNINGELYIAHIPSYYFGGDNSIDKIEFRVLNSELKWTGVGLDSNYRRSIFLQWLGSSKNSYEIDKDSDVDDVLRYSMGVRYIKQKQNFEMGKECTFVLKNNINDYAELFFDYFADDYLFMYNPNCDIHLSIRVNGEKVATVPIERGENKRIISGMDLQKALEKNNDEVVIELTSSNTYNLAKMNILPREKEDRSIEIREVRIGTKWE